MAHWTFALQPNHERTLFFQFDLEFICLQAKIILLVFSDENCNMLYISLCSRHEYISGYYRTSAYFISKLMADLIPMRTIPSIIFTCIIYFMLGKYGLLQSYYNLLNKSTRHSHFMYVHVYLYRLKQHIGTAVVTMLAFSIPCCLQKRHTFKDLSIHVRICDMSHLHCP